MARDLDQERAAQAWKDVQQGMNRDYKNAAKAISSMIMNNGLMQTLAFFYQKGDSQKKLSNHVSVWILKVVFREQAGPANHDPFRRAMEQLHQTGESVVYRRATEEALAYLRWVRQFASALIGD